MNNERRKKLDRIKMNLNYILKDLEKVKDEESDAFDNMPENLQCSMRGSDSEDAINYMEDAISNIEEAISNLDEVM